MVDDVESGTGVGIAREVGEKTMAVSKVRIVVEEHTGEGLCP